MGRFVWAKLMVVIKGHVANKRNGNIDDTLSAVDGTHIAVDDILTTAVNDTFTAVDDTLTAVDDPSLLLMTPLTAVNNILTVTCW